jgi:drug/metabolite transporter (DMT)-like permease
MNWFLIALLAPIFWAITNHIDKYLITRYFKGGGVGALMIFSAVIGVILLPIIFIIEPQAIHLQGSLAVLLIFNGFLYVVGMLPYFYAMKEDEASIVVPLFQLIPVFNYFLALVVLKENLSWLQIIASLFIILGAILISLEVSQKKFITKVFLLMVLSSFLVSLNALIFKFVAIKGTFWTTSFWEYIGFSVFSILLLVLVKSYRQQFFYILKNNKLAVISINGVNEVLNIIAKIVMNFATLLAPLALVWVVNGFQPFFVLFFGVLLALFFPKLTNESLNKKHLFQKALAIVIMFIGVYLLNL